jgi:DNA-binding NarL/FixJ family response regulator
MRVLIVADNALAAEAIRREMRHASGCRVTGFVNGRRPCAVTVAQEDPEVVLVDDMRSSEVTLERIGELRTAAPKAKILLLTLRMDPAWLAEASAAGVDAAVAKAAHPGSLGTLVREVVRGNVFHAFAPSPAPSEPFVSRHALTSRELEILTLAASGSSNGHIAERLWVTEQTVKFHLSNVYRKLGVANRTQASHFAHQHGLLEPQPTAGAHRAAPVRAAA